MEFQDVFQSFLFVGIARLLSAIQLHGLVGHFAALLLVVLIDVLALG